LPDAAAVHNSLESRPRATDGTYNALWDTWLIPRVDGQFSGTTDEIFQWAACKWGLPDNVIRAVAVRESTWFQGLHFADGQCYWNRGCGDAVSSADPSTQVFCDGLAAFGHDYQTDTNSTAGAYPWSTPKQGMCPKTFSILGEMAWWSPTWGYNYAGNQDGSFPFSRDSTAFAADFYGSQIRGCYNGYQWELGSAYKSAPNDLWGCVGAWYSGSWHDSAGDAYAGRVQTELSNHTWLQSSFGPNTGQYQCDAVKGCPK
jgi:hypothetical protein